MCKSFSKIAELWSGDVTNIEKLLFWVVVPSCTPLAMWRAHILFILTTT